MGVSYLDRLIKGCDAAKKTAPVKSFSSNNYLGHECSKLADQHGTRLLIYRTFFNDYRSTSLATYLFIES